MKHKSKLGIAALLGMLLIILDTSAGLTGASEGIQLCINVVIPSLFPFVFLSAIIRYAFSGSEIRPLRSVGRILGIPSGYESILILSILGGYPVGAQAVASAWKDDGLQTTSAQKMLSFCSNAGPSFIFGMLGTQFSFWLVPWLLWAIHILSSLFVGFILRNDNQIAHVISKNKNKPAKFDVQTTLKSSLQVMSVICGWVILFRVLISVLNKWLPGDLPGQFRVVVAGILELTNGCTMLINIPSNPVRFILCSTLLAFGGVCICLQTASIIGDLGIKHYIKGKILQSLISIILSWLTCVYLFPSELNLPWVIPFSIFIILTIYLGFTRRKNTNRCRNCVKCDV